MTAGRLVKWEKPNDDSRHKEKSKEKRKDSIFLSKVFQLPLLDLTLSIVRLNIGEAQSRWQEELSSGLLDFAAIVFIKIGLTIYYLLIE